MNVDQNKRDISIPVPLLIFVFFFLYYLSTLGAKGGYATDSNENFALSMSILRNGDFFPDDVRTRIYHGYAFSILPLPFYVLGGWVSSLYPDQYYNHILRSSLCVYNMAVTALTLTLFYLIARQFHFSRRTGVTLTLGLGLATLVFPYARYDFNQPAANLFLAAQACFLLRWLDHSRIRDLLISGAALGLAIWSRTEYGLLILPLVAALIFRRETHPRAWAVALAPSAAALGFVMMYNYHYWGAGSILMGGYGQSPHAGNPLVSLWGLLLSPGKSVFIYCPLVLLAIPSLPLFVRNQGFRGWLWLSHGGIVLLFYCFAHYWWGGWCWGPRLTLPILPAAVLAIGALLETAGVQMRRVCWILFILLGAAGFGIQWAGALYDFNDGIKYQTTPIEKGGLGLDEMTLYTTWSESAIPNHLRLINGQVPEFRVDLAALEHARQGNPGAFVVFYTILMMGVLLALVLLIHAGYIQQDETRNMRN